MTPSVWLLGPEATDADRGLVLLGELGCVHCHAPSTKEKEFIEGLPAPNLKVGAGNLTPEFIHHWLKNPEQRGHSTMPDVLHALSEEERASTAASLTAYLHHHAKRTSQLSGEGKHEPSSEKGSELFKTIGCAACHQTMLNSAVSPHLHQLPFLKGKFEEGRLKAFLLDPELHRPSGRMPRVPLTEDEASDLAAYLEGGLGRSIPKVSLPHSESLVKAGEKAYHELHCVRCHGVVDDEPKSIPMKPLPLLSELSGKGGCLSGEKGGKGVHYYFTDRERGWIKAALERTKEAKPLPTEKKISQKLAALSCYNCHQRNGGGGPSDSGRDLFHTSGEDLEDEGRFPPLLTGVGRKLQEQAMVRIIQGEGGVRPYMVTRMPDFGEKHATDLAAFFAKADHDPNERPTPRNGEENQVGRNMWGRALVGTTGLSCITCHQLNGKRSLGIQAMDLAHAPDRLRPAWFRDYLINPAKFRPGTRMPSFWPDGKPMLKGNGNSTDRQIDSIWVYLSEIDQSRLPEGMEKKGNFELKPKGRPMIFRTFMEGAGMHGIAIGFERGFHASFDVDTIAWSQAWQGRFLDAEGTWDDRFTPLAPPLGKAVVDLPGDDWVRKDHPEGGRAALTFRGYRLDKQGEPTFLIDAEGVGLEDHLSATGNGLSRTVTADRQTRLWIKVLSGKNIRKAGKAWINEAGLTVAAGDLESMMTGHGKGQQLWLLLTKEIQFNWTWKGGAE